MSDITTTNDRDAKNGRFLPGNSGYGGRPKGARSKLGEAFLEDLRDAWNEHGATALARCATEEPAQFVRVVASLLPRDVDINVTATIDATSFAQRFRTALELLGNEPQPKTIEHADVRQRR
jgi:hypothetical protein